MRLYLKGPICRIHDVHSSIKPSVALHAAAPFPLFKKMNLHYKLEVLGLKEVGIYEAGGVS